jgi:hypothetical protein
MGVESQISLSTMLQVLEILAILGGGGTVAFKLGKTTTRVEDTLTRQNEILVGQSQEITELKEETKKVNDVLTKIAVQENRLERIEEDIRDMQHGRGFFPDAKSAIMPAS